MSMKTNNNNKLRWNDLNENLRSRNNAVSCTVQRCS